MASILDRYGIKEVADVTFYELDNGKPVRPVLYCDTLKVSTIEQTADEATANGGKGNVALISWDYNKDINVTIEDALFSAKSMAILFGNGKPDTFTNGLIMKTENFKATATGTAAQAGWKEKFEGPDGKLYNKINPKYYNEFSEAVTTFEEGKTYFCSFDLLADGSAIRIGASTFPGTYYVVGDTFARSQADGKDEFFQFIISKAKITSENTITMEADGDPSVFNMNLHVLRPESGDMMKLVKYDLLGGADSELEALEIYHNHVLDVANTGDTASDIADAIADAGIDTGDVTDLGIVIIEESGTEAIGSLTGVVTIVGTVPAWLTIENTADTAVTATVGSITQNEFVDLYIKKGTDAYKVKIVAVNS